MAKTPRLVNDSIGGRITIGRNTEQLTCKLTDEEKWDLAVGTCELVVALARLEEDKKAHMQVFNEQIKEAKARLDIAAREVKTGLVSRDVEVESVYDQAEEVVYRIRTDTIQTISKRKPTADERNGTFTEAA